ncbi:recombination-associated protein RdgC, partial [Pseudomonas aeruginosa]
IAPALGLNIVNESNAKKAEDPLSTLSEAVGSPPVRPVAVKVAPSATLTDWPKNQQASEGFSVLDNCELNDTNDEGGTVRCKRQDLNSEEIQNHLSAGKLVTR